MVRQAIGWQAGWEGTSQDMPWDGYEKRLDAYLPTHLKDEVGHWLSGDEPLLGTHDEEVRALVEEAL